MKQGTDEWRAARLGKITASRLDAVLSEGRGGKPSVTRENYLYAIVSERMTGIPYEKFHSAFMEDGSNNEGEARTFYEATYGVMVIEDGGMICPAITDFWASPDGLIGNDGGLEIKCPETKKHVDTIDHLKLFSNKIVDTKYIYQMTGNLIVYGRKWWDFESFDPALPDNIKMFVMRFNKDDLPVKKVLEGIDQFRRDLDATEKKLRSWGKV